MYLHLSLLGTRKPILAMGPALQEERMITLAVHHAERYDVVYDRLLQVL